MTKMGKCAVLIATLALIVIMGRGVAQTAVATSLADLQAASSCLTANSESFRYLLFDVLLGFDDAKSFCASLVDLDDPALTTGLTNPSFFLGRVSSFAERTQLITLLNVQVALANRVNFWIGLEDESDIGGTDTRARFLRWVDGDTKGLDASFIGVTNGVIPWAAGQPDDVNGNENCVRWNVATNFLDDQICSQNNAFLCRVNCDPSAFQPTNAPTHSPVIVTDAPTRSPAIITDAPTRSPAIITDAPTISPTSADGLANLTDTQIIAGASVLSAVALFLILGIIYGIRSIYKEKERLGMTAMALPLTIDYIDFSGVNKNRVSPNSSEDQRDSYSTAFPTSSPTKPPKNIAVNPSL